MTKSIALVLALAILGDTVTNALDAPIPGATIGMALLVGLFALRGGPDANSARLFDGAAPYFPLFFVPAASGLVASSDLLVSAWLHIATAILFSTVAAIAVTGLLVQNALVLVQKVRRG